ncbi:MAG: hypothetical protein GY841_10440 [FCB group bacterium]|nr:hypothetical protein [FCB group bacterium]
MLTLRQRPLNGDARIYTVDLDTIAQGWQRSTRAVGGYYSAGFNVNGISSVLMRDYFYNWIGRVVREETAGVTTWEGIVYKLSLIQDGVEHIISMEPDKFHNAVDVYYTDSAVVDANVGAMAYLVAQDRFQDTGQDFTPWAGTDPAPYRIQINNTNDTVTTAYIGHITSAPANDTVAVYTNRGLTSQGWTGVDPAGLTAANYQIIEVDAENQRISAGLAEDANSQAEYGESQYFVTQSGADSTAAEALRDRHLAEFAYPRARMVNQGDAENTLVVTCAGLWFTSFWRYWTHSETGTASELITSLTGDTEFLTAGRIDTNTLDVTCAAYDIPQRIGDLLERVVSQGDASGNLYNCGVYENRVLHYEQAPTTAAYYLDNGVLKNLGGQPVIPQMIKPGFLVATDLGSVLNPLANTQSQATYVEQVEYFRDSGELLLSLIDDSGSIITLQQQIAGNR